MVYKSYKFTNKNGVEIKVRFYFTGIYTIVDKNGEHELGTWRKEPLLVGRHLKTSKDKSRVIYRARPFDCHFDYADYALRDVALQLANDATRSNRITI